MPRNEADNHSVSRRAAVAGAGGLAAAGLASACESQTGASRHETIAPTPVSAGVPARGMGLVLLGTQAGPPVVPYRAGIASALVVDGYVYIIDCGRAAVTQFARAGLRFQNIRGIFLTHLHIDHLVDYYNFFVLNVAGHGDRMPEQVPVYGPGPATGLPEPFSNNHVPTVAPQSSTPGTIAMTDRLHSAFAYSSNMFIRASGDRDPRDLVDPHEITLPNVGASHSNVSPRTTPFPVMEDNRVKVTATLVHHGAVFPAFAFRFDSDHGSVTFSGDTAQTDNLVHLAQGSDLFVCEAINIKGADMPPALAHHMASSHIPVQHVGEFAQRCGSSHLVLTHIADLASTKINKRQWNAWARSGYDGTVTVGDDLHSVAVTPR